MTDLQSTDPIQNSHIVINANFHERDSLYVVPTSVTPVFNLAAGRTQKLVLATGVPTVPSVINMVAGAVYRFIIMQNSVGDGTLVWPAQFKGPMEVGSLASSCSVQQFICDGSYLYPTGMGAINV